MNYSVSLQKIPRASPSGFPLDSGYISLYIPPLVTIQIQYVHPNMVQLSIVQLSIVQYNIVQNSFVQLSTEQLSIGQISCEQCTI